LVFLNTDKDFRSISYKPPFALLMGSEQNGLSKNLIDACDDVVKMPIYGKAESLNVAVATGIMLYAALAAK
jgi:TrmH family RNA methyltransferase